MPFLWKILSGKLCQRKGSLPSFLAFVVLWLCKPLIYWCCQVNCAYATTTSSLPFSSLCHCRGSFYFWSQSSQQAMKLIRMFIFAGADGGFKLLAMRTLFIFHYTHLGYDMFALNILQMKIMGSIQPTPTFTLMQSRRSFLLAQPLFQMKYLQSGLQSWHLTEKIPLTMPHQLHQWFHPAHLTNCWHQLSQQEF